MSDINAITLMGRLVRDPECRTGSSGADLSMFCMALNHFYQDKNGQRYEERAFVPCVAFSRAAEQAAQKHKGNPLLVMGRLRTDRWRSNGTTQTRLVLVVQEIHSVQPVSKAAATGPEAEHEVRQSLIPF